MVMLAQKKTASLGINLLLQYFYNYNYTLEMKIEGFGMSFFYVNINR